MLISHKSKSILIEARCEVLGWGSTCVASMHVCAHVCDVKGSALGVIPQGASHLVLENLSIHLGRLVDEPRDLPSSLQHRDYKCPHSHPAVFPGPWELNSGPCAYRESTLQSSLHSP